MPEKRLLTLDLAHNDARHAKHQRLKDHLVGEMIAGRLKPGEMIPSEHRLVKTLGVARTTVRQAMAGLEKDGLIRHHVLWNQLGADPHAGRRSEQAPGRRQFHLCRRTCRLLVRKHQPGHAHRADNPNRRRRGRQLRVLSGQSTHRGERTT